MVTFLIQDLIDLVQKRILWFIAVVAGDEIERERSPKEYELLNAMRSICQAKRPEVMRTLASASFSSIYTH